MLDLREAIAAGPVLADGGWGTELQKRGLPLGQCPDFWNIEQPERVAEVARAYVEAGSRVILTNTFRSNALALEEYKYEHSAFAIARAGARISREAAGDRAWVFGSLGPTGKLLALQEVSDDGIREAFREQAAGLAEGGVDALLFETMSDPAEAALGVEAAQSTGLPVLVSFVFDTGRNKDRTMTGATPEQAVERMAGAGVQAIGANCGVGIEAYVPVCRRLRASTPLPLWIKANAGLPEMENDRAVYRTAPEEFAAHIPALIAAGANFVGGCCGTNPDFIRAAARFLASPCA